MAGPPLGFDPRQIPVSSIDADLPPVSLDRLQADALRARFHSPPAWAPEIISDNRRLEQVPRAASVLIAVMQRPQPSIVLTQRTAHLTAHAGQISFPGGRAEPEDRDAMATALREAHEEIGLPPQKVDVLGTLPKYTTGTGFSITPVVGLVEPDFSLKIDPHEVAEVFEVPFEFLMSPAHHRRHLVNIPGMRREFLSMPWSGASSVGEAREYFIWGATASILRNLYRFLSA